MIGRPNKSECDLVWRYIAILQKLTNQTGSLSGWNINYVHSYNRVENYIRTQEHIGRWTFPRYHFRPSYWSGLWLQASSLADFTGQLSATANWRELCRNDIIHSYSYSNKILGCTKSNRCVTRDIICRNCCKNIVIFDYYIRHEAWGH